MKLLSIPYKVERTILATPTEPEEFCSNNWMCIIAIGSVTYLLNIDAEWECFNILNYGDTDLINKHYKYPTGWGGEDLLIQMLDEDIIKLLKIINEVTDEFGSDNLPSMGNFSSFTRAHARLI